MDFYFFFLVWDYYLLLIKIYFDEHVICSIIFHFFGCWLTHKENYWEKQEWCTFFKKYMTYMTFFFYEKVLRNSSSTGPIWKVYITQTFTAQNTSLRNTHKMKLHKEHFVFANISAQFVLNICFNILIIGGEIVKMDFAESLETKLV